MTGEESRKIMSAFCNGYEFPFGNGKVNDCDMAEVERHAILLEYALKRMTKEEETKMNLKIKYLADIQKIEKVSVGDWIDLRAAVDVDIRKGEFMYIPLGVAMELPEGYEAIVAPRSSTFKIYGILMANSIGVIDHSYCGDNDEWCFPAYAVRDTHVLKNNRICQFRLVPNQPYFDIEEVDTLGNANRGGLGSTGKD